MCRSTAPYVRDLARVTGASVTLLHVIGERPNLCGAADVHWAMDGYGPLRDLERMQMSALATFRDEYFGGVRCNLAIEFGSVAEQVVRYAEHTCADLITMSSRGTVSGRPFTRSITATVLQHASCAVWISTHSDDLKPFTGLQSIVCALSPDRAWPVYLEEATRLGAAFGAKVTFASAIPEGWMPQEPRVLTLEEEYPEAVPAARGCAVYMECGSVGRVVRHVAEIQDADIVVMNRTHGPRTGGFETHACEIALESPCPVLALPLMKGKAVSISVAETREVPEKYALAAAACC